MHRRRPQPQAGRGLVVGSLVYFVCFSLVMHYLVGHQSWPISIIGSVVSTVLWSALMAFWLGLLPRPRD